MATLCVRVLGAETVVCVADEGGSSGGSNEGLARQGVDPVGGASASGKIMSDGLWIGCIFSHYLRGEQGKGQHAAGEEKEAGGQGWPRPL